MKLQTELKAAAVDYAKAVAAHRDARRPFRGPHAARPTFEEEHALGLLNLAERQAHQRMVVAGKRYGDAIRSHEIDKAKRAGQ